MEFVIKFVLTLLVHTVVTVKVDIYCKATIKIVQVISQNEICNTQSQYNTYKILYFQSFICSIVSRSLFPTYSTTSFFSSFCNIYASIC